MSDPALMILLAHVAALHDLSEWPPVGALVQEVLALQSGSGSVSRTDAMRLQRWARRWGAVDPTLRTFYAAHAAHPDAGKALWAILDHQPYRHGASYFRLRRLWVNHRGTRGSMVLVPHLP